MATNVVTASSDKPDTAAVNADDSANGPWTDVVTHPATRTVFEPRRAHWTR